jgi:hypothetical protein
VAAVFSPFPSTAQGESACDLGFALTSGGVPEADLNGDGLTCEVASVDPGTGLLAIFALDNAPADPTTTRRGCPPPQSGFAPVSANLAAPNVDRNRDEVICAKGQSMITPHPVFIDNNVPIKLPTE